MMRALRSMAIAVPALFVAGLAISQGIEWETLNQEVMDLHRAGRYDRAVVVAKKALKVAERSVGPDHPAVATSLNKLAGLYQARASTRRRSRSTSARCGYSRRRWARTMGLEREPFRFVLHTP